MWTAATVFLKLFSKFVDILKAITRRRSIEAEIETRKKAAAYDKLSKALSARRDAGDRFLRDGVHDDGYRRD